MRLTAYHGTGPEEPLVGGQDPVSRHRLTSLWASNSYRLAAQFQDKIAVLNAVSYRGQAGLSIGSPPIQLINSLFQCDQSFLDTYQRGIGAVGRHLRALPHVLSGAHAGKLGSGQD